MSARAALLAQLFSQCIVVDLGSEARNHPLAHNTKYGESLSAALNEIQRISIEKGDPIFGRLFGSTHFKESRGRKFDGSQSCLFNVDSPNTSEAFRRVERLFAAKLLNPFFDHSVARIVPTRGPPADGRS